MHGLANHQGADALLALSSAALVFLGGLAPAAAAESPTGSLVADHFRRLNRSAVWHKVAEVKLAFPSYHPQGMTIVGNRFYLSSVEVIDRQRGQGVGHLFEVDFEGNRLRQIQLGDGPIYHPGGIDFDGKWVWVPVAEYRPASRSIVCRVDPISLDVERLFEFEDHLGALVCDATSGCLVGASWGSRRFYRWELADDGLGPVVLHPAAPFQLSNTSHYVDYQDGQHLRGTPFALFGGVAGYPAEGPGAPAFALGGLALVNLQTLQTAHEIPVSLRTAQGRSLLQNPFAVEVVPGGLRIHFISGDDDSTLFTYEVK